MMERDFPILALDNRYHQGITLQDDIVPISLANKTPSSTVEIISKVDIYCLFKCLFSIDVRSRALLLEF